MEVMTIQKYLHTSPRKLRLVADMVRKMEPERAVRVLELTNKAAAEPLAKAIKTAIANARQQKLNEANLAFKSLEVNESTKLRRFHAGSRGRANTFKRRFSSIRVILIDEPKQEQKEVKSKKEKVENKNAKTNKTEGGKN